MKMASLGLNGQGCHWGNPIEVATQRMDGKDIYGRLFVKIMGNLRGESPHCHKEGPRRKELPMPPRPFMNERL